MLLALVLAFLPQQKLNAPLPSGGDVTHVAWQPSGASVLYFGDVESDNLDELFRVELVEGLPRARVNEELYQPSNGYQSLYAVDGRACLFVPGTTRVLFGLTTVDGKFSFTSGVVGRTLGGEEPQVGVCQGSGLRFGAGGRVVYTQVPSPPFHQVYGRPADGSAAAVRLNPGILGTRGDYRLTPDGTRVVLSFQVVNPGPQQPWGLYSVPVDGSTPAVLLNGTANAQRTTSDFRAGDARVVYAADDALDNVVELWSAPIDGSSAPIRLHAPLDPTRSVSGFELVPGQERVVFAASLDVPGRQGLYVVPIEGGTPVELSAGVSPALNVSTGVGFPLLLTPDGTRVVFAARTDTDPGRRLYVAPLDASSPPQPLSPSTDHIGATFARLANGGRAIVFALDATVVTQHELWYVPTDGSEPARRISPQMVAGGGIQNTPEGPRFEVTPGGRFAYYLADQDTDEVFELYRVPTDGSLLSERCNAPLVAGGDVTVFAMGPSGHGVVYLADQDADEVFEAYLREFPRPVPSPRPAQAPTGPVRSSP